jgi:hypothetical protein
MSVGLCAVWWMIGACGPHSAHIVPHYFTNCIPSLCSGGLCRPSAWIDREGTKGETNSGITALLDCGRGSVRSWKPWRVAHEPLKVLVKVMRGLITALVR